MKTNRVLFYSLSVLLVLGLFFTGRGVTLVAAADNTAPTADPITLSTLMNTPVDFVLLGSDVDGDELYYCIDQDPQFGTLSGESPNLTYIPGEDFFGEDSLAYVVFDGTEFSAPALVTFSVKEQIDNTPVAYGMTAELLEDGTLDFALQGNDKDGDMTFEVLTTTGPVYGTLSGTAPNLTYTPNPNFYGQDGFLFRVVDEGLTSDPAEVKFAITPVNDLPVASGQAVSTDLDVPAVFTLLGSDVESDPLTYTVETAPAHGTLSGTAPELTYTPDSGFSGEDALTFIVSDAYGVSEPATVAITVRSAIAPVTVFFDDFEQSKGWTSNTVVGDEKTAIIRWERANPMASDMSGIKQRGVTTSGLNNLVTGYRAGANPNDFDADGYLSVRSPMITLPKGKDLTLTFNYYFAHDKNSTTLDFLKVKVVGATTKMVLREFGGPVDDDAFWTKFSSNLTSFAGQSVYIEFIVKDGGVDNLVEAAIDDILIIAK